MIVRTVVCVLLAVALCGWFGLRLAPAFAADHGLSLRVGLMLVAAGALWSGLRLFARRSVEARNAQAGSFWGYAAPSGARDLLAILLIFVGAGFLAWGMA